MRGCGRRKTNRGATHRQVLSSFLGRKMPHRKLSLNFPNFKCLGYDEVFKSAEGEKSVQDFSIHYMESSPNVND